MTATTSRIRYGALVAVGALSLAACSSSASAPLSLPPAPPSGAATSLSVPSVTIPPPTAHDPFGLVAVDLLPGYPMSAHHDLGRYICRQLHQGTPRARLAKHVAGQYGTGRSAATLLIGSAANTLCHH